MRIFVKLVHRNRRILQNTNVSIMHTSYCLFISGHELNNGEYDPDLYCQYIVLSVSTRGVSLVMSMSRSTSTLLCHDYEYKFCISPNT